VGASAAWQVVKCGHRWVVAERPKLQAPQSKRCGRHRRASPGCKPLAGGGEATTTEGLGADRRQEGIAFAMPPVALCSNHEAGPWVIASRRCSWWVCWLWLGLALFWGLPGPSSLSLHESSWRVKWWRCCALKVPARATGLLAGRPEALQLGTPGCAQHLVTGGRQAVLGMPKRQEGVAC